MARRANSRIDRNRALGTDKRNRWRVSQISRIPHRRINTDVDGICSGEFNLIIVAAGTENPHALNRTQPGADNRNDFLSGKSTRLVEFAIRR